MTLDQNIFCKFNKNKYYVEVTNYLYSFFSFILIMERVKNSKRLFEILEDNDIIFTLYKDVPSYDTDQSNELILGRFIENSPGYTEIIPNDDSENPIQYEFESKNKTRIEIYLDSILKKSQQSIDVPLSKMSDSWLDDWLEQLIVEEINETTVHELIHKEGQIMHDENYVKTKKTLDKASRLLDYFIYVNTHRDQILTGKPVESRYLFFWNDFSFLSKNAAYDINLEKEKLKQAFKKLRPSSYDPNLSDDIITDENFESLLYEGHKCVNKGKREEAIEGTLKQFKIGYLPGFGQEAFRRFLKKALY